MNEESQKLFKSGYYGNSIVGSWCRTQEGCTHAWKEHFPTRMCNADLRKPFNCPNKHPLQYDEAE